ncbi:MAG: ATP-binding protein [Bacteroidota bacterium]
MIITKRRKLSLPLQYAISVLLIGLISSVCFAASDYIGYKVVALLLLLVVSLLAMMLDIKPVLSAAVLSAIIWNFFFIPPIYTLHIDNAEDILMFLMYFVIALVNAVLTFKIREVEMKARDKEEKENTIKLYNTLLNSLSHELRTPISTIIGAVDTLIEHKDKLSPQYQNDLLNEIDTASIRLNRQVENLLNQSRLETGTLLLKLDWCDTNELIYSILYKLSFATQFHQIVFEADEQLPLFKLDSGLMEQVFINILLNAIHYTPEKSIIKIEVSYHSGNCIIIISDNGKGFPENDIENVFDKFYRLPQTKTGGIGLGLSIVKGFVEAHKGTIKLENIQPNGARFNISIPAETSFINHLKNE